MDKLIKLAQKLDKEFKDSNFDTDKFHLMAAKVLGEVNPEDISIDIIHNHIDNKLIDNQFIVDDSFGEPSITLYSSDEIQLDILVWTTGDTNAHSHGFTGAFKVMHGEIVQASYKTEHFHEKPYDYLIRDNVNLSEVKRLKVNDIQEIPSGLNLIHKSLHTVSPTINLVFRTRGNRELEKGMCQHSVYFPDLLIAPFRASTRLVKKVSFINSLLKSDLDLGLSSLKNFMKKVTDSTLIGLKKRGIPGINFSISSQKIFTEQVDNELVKRNLFDTLASSNSYEVNFNKQFEDFSNDKFTRTVHSLLECRLPISKIKIFFNENKIEFIEDNLYDVIISYYKKINDLKFLSIHLNGTAFEVFELLVRSYSEEEVIEKFVNDFDVSIEVARRDVRQTTSTLKEIYSLNYLI
jgi:hypothetical protein